MNSFTKGDEFKPIGVNEHMRFYKYDPGQFILKHDDYRMSRFRYDADKDEYYEQMSFLTVVIYLNEDFQNLDNNKVWFNNKELSEIGLPMPVTKILKDHIKDAQSFL